MKKMLLLLATLLIAAGLLTAGYEENPDKSDTPNSSGQDSTITILALLQLQQHSH